MLDSVRCGVVWVDFLLFKGVDMPNIKVGIAAGYSPTWAIRGCLLPSVKAWARARGLSPERVSALINGSVEDNRKAEAIRAALVEELGVERWWLDELLEDIRAEWLKRNGG
jgi:hypothetical protein